MTDVVGLFDRHPGIEVVTLDFFDTLVTRVVGQPSHVFAVMEDRLLARDGRRWAGFARQRVSAEIRARRAAAIDDPLRDVSIDEIMVELSRRCGLSSSECAELISLEASVEIECVKPVNFGVQVTQEAHRRGLRMLIVSDNYMSSGHLAAMANAAGYDWVTPAHVMVSSEHGGQKHNGALWQAVAEHVGVPTKRVLHFGDDPIADHEQPSRLGISTHINGAMRTSHRDLWNTGPSVLPLSRLEAHLRDEMAPQPWDSALALGHGVIAMIVAAQIVDVQAVLARRPVAGVHFAARDGWLAHRVWNRLRDAGHPLPEASYLSFSRSVAWRANLTELDDAVALRFIDQHERLTPRRLGRRFGCEMRCAHASDIAVDADTARKILLDNSAAVLEASRALKERMLGHLRATRLLEEGHHLVVDLGWTGSTIADLAEVVTHETGGRSTIEGRLLGFYFDSVPHRARVALHGFAMNDFEPLNDQIRLIASWRLFESLITAPHGSVADYAGAEHAFAPVHAETAPEVRAYAELVGRVGDAAVESALAILNGSHPSGVTARDITGKSVWAAMMQVAHTPRHDELDALGSINHVASVDYEGDGIPIIATAPPSSSTIPFERMGEIYDSIIKQHWLQGSIRQWAREKSSEWFAGEICRRWSFMGTQWMEPPVL
jgi:FMN phosphatase YigB (HAD superfamily)